MTSAETLTDEEKAEAKVQAERDMWSASGIDRMIFIDEMIDHAVRMDGEGPWIFVGSVSVMQGVLYTLSGSQQVLPYRDVSFVLVSNAPLTIMKDVGAHRLKRVRGRIKKPECTCGLDLEGQGLQYLVNHIQAESS